MWHSFHSFGSGNGANIIDISVDDIVIYPYSLGSDNGTNMTNQSLNGSDGGVCTYDLVHGFGCSSDYCGCDCDCDCVFGLNFVVLSLLLDKEVDVDNEDMLCYALMMMMEIPKVAGIHFFLISSTTIIFRSKLLPLSILLSSFMLFLYILFYYQIT